MWKATIRMWKLDYRISTGYDIKWYFQIQTLVKGCLALPQLFCPSSNKTWFNHDIEKPFYRHPRALCLWGGVAALMNRLGILETRLFLDH